MYYDKTGMSEEVIALLDGMDDLTLRWVLYARSLPHGEYSIYRILNNANKKSYIGKTNNTKRRIQQHFNDLKHGKHASKKLQADYNLYGIEVFTAEVVTPELYDQEVREYENAWIAYYASVRNGYNTQYYWNNEIKECVDLISSLEVEREHFPEEFSRGVIPIYAD